MARERERERDKAGAGCAGRNVSVKESRGKVSRIDEEGRYLLQRATFVSSASTKHENSGYDGAIGANNNGRA